MEPERELPAQVAGALERLDELVRRFEEHPEPAVQERVVELLRCVDEVHRAGLRRLNELLKVAGLQRRAIDDPEVKLLLDLYDLGEGGDEARAEAVVQDLRPSVEAVGGGLELVDADGDTVRVRLSAPAHGCDSSGLRGSVEQALRDALPGVDDVQVLEAAPPAVPGSFVPLTRLLRPSWHPVAALADLPRNGLRSVDVGGERVLLANLGGGEVYAFVNACPGSPFPLDAGPVEDGILRCPWHGCRFDLRGGRRVDAQAPGLGVLPVTVDAEGMLRVQVRQSGAAA